MIANLMGGDGVILIVVALIVLVGGSQLPKIARNVGLAGKEFRQAQAEAEEDAEKSRKAKSSAQDQMAIPAIPAPPAAQPLADPAAPAAPVGANGSGDPGITLTPAQLDALLKAREEQVRSEGPASSN